MIFLVLIPVSLDRNSCRSTDVVFKMSRLYLSTLPVLFVVVSWIGYPVQVPDIKSGSCIPGKGAVIISKVCDIFISIIYLCLLFNPLSIT